MTRRTKFEKLQTYNCGFQDGNLARRNQWLFKPAGILRSSRDRHYDQDYQAGYEVGFNNTKVTP